MKLSAYHKQRGDSVEWYMPFNYRYDRVYMSKVFSFSEDFTDCINADEVIRGGTGYAIRNENGVEVYDSSCDEPLPKWVEHLYPDYSLQPIIMIEKEQPIFRRFTPRELYRLMGVGEADIDKLLATDLSRTSHYKLAGNSIVVDCLAAIFKNLFSPEEAMPNSLF